jgi:hypothetical protein
MPTPTIVVLAAIALLATAQPPSPTPVPTEPPLREIGRVHVTTPLCKTLATHAVVAANLALEDDRKITFTLGTLRGVDLDKNIIAKNRGTDQIRREYAALRAGAVQGEAEMKKFREALKEVTNDEQRAALEKFADALDGALYRQKKLAEDLGRYLAWLDAQEPLTDQERADIERSLLAGLNPASPSPFGRTPSQPQTIQNPFGNFALIPETLSHSAKRAADELDTRATLIYRDEDAAADRIDTAFKGC